MKLVLAALSRPITVVVALVAIALCAVLAIQRMPVDIFPQVGDPAIYVAQTYGGMDPAQMENYLTYYYEYHFLYITGIDHVDAVAEAQRLVTQAEIDDALARLGVWRGLLSVAAVAGDIRPFLAEARR